MPPEELTLTAAGIGGLAYVATQLFGKTLAAMGDDINKAYQSNRDKLLNKAASKVDDPNDGASPNLRVARDIIWNGTVTDDEVCAEYFGGLLAASRSSDGKDDSALIYVDCIKALSSKQLHLHFIIYNSLQCLLLKAGKNLNPGMQDEFSLTEVWFSTMELEKHLGLSPLIDLNILHRQGLVNGYATNNHVVGTQSLPYAKAHPTTFGVLLYAAALNSLPMWSLFGKSEFPRSSDIMLPNYQALTLDELCLAVGLVNPSSDAATP